MSAVQGCSETSVSSPSDAIPLKIYKLSGKECGMLGVIRVGDAWAAEDDPAVTGESEGALRHRIFEAIEAAEPDFPCDVFWFLERIQFSSVQDHGSFATCTVLFPPLEIDDTRSSWDEAGPPPEQPIVAGRWSDPQTLRVFFFFADSVEQQTLLARFLLSASGCTLCTSNADLLEAISKILRSPRFIVVNSLQDAPYKGVQYDTTLWHLLFEKSSRWNYSGFTVILRALLSRADLDFSKTGWSWKVMRMASAYEICFHEWCAIASKHCSKHRHMWANTREPRLYLLGICVHLPERDTGRSRVDCIFENMTAWMDQEILFAKHCSVLKDALLSDLESLSRGPPLPAAFFRSDEALLVHSAVSNHFDTLQDEPVD